MQALTSLAPELYGWYGAPAVNLAGQTSLFLIGNHFNVTQTRVVVGGKECTDREMLSRQVMRITIPAGTLAVTRDNGMLPDCPPEGAKAYTSETGHIDLFVDVHAATPYGVTSHMLVPACSLQQAADSSGQTASGTAGNGLAWLTDKLEVAYTFQGLGIVAATQPPVVRPQTLKIDISKAAFAGDTVSISVTVPGPTSPATITLGEFPLDPIAVTTPTVKTVTIPNTAVSNFAIALCNSIGAQFGPAATNSPAPVKSTSTTVQLKQGGVVVQQYQLSNHLTINWVQAASGSSTTKTGS